MIRQLVVLADDRGGDLMASKLFRERLKRARETVAIEIARAREDEGQLESLDIWGEYEHMLLVMPLAGYSRSS